jgi:hypothetical protein
VDGVWAIPYSHFKGVGGYGNETAKILGQHEY